MSEYTVGALAGVPASQRPDLLAPSTRIQLEELGLITRVGVVEIDPSISDTAASRDAFGLDPDALANCVVVGGRREGIERLAACVVLSSTRADVNGAVRRRLDVRKASFLPKERAVELTGMEYGGINPFGLPADWPVLVDRRVADGGLVILGSGVRRSKLIVAGGLLSSIPAAEVVDGLAG